MQSTLPSNKDFKSQAKIFRFIVGEENIKHGQALDFLSKEYGFKDWNTASAIIEKNSMPSVKKSNNSSEIYRVVPLNAPLITSQDEITRMWASPANDVIGKSDLDFLKKKFTLHGTSGSTPDREEASEIFIRDLVPASSREENKLIPVMIRVKREEEVKEKYPNDYPLYIELTRHIPMSLILEVYNFNEGIFYSSPIDGTLIKISENIISCVELGSGSCIGNKEQSYYRSSRFGSSVKQREKVFSSPTKILLPVSGDIFLIKKIIPAVGKWREQNPRKISSGLSGLKAILEIMERSNTEKIYLASVLAFQDSSLLFSQDAVELSRFSRHQSGAWFHKKELIKKAIKAAGVTKKKEQKQLMGSILQYLN